MRSVHTIKKLFPVPTGVFPVYCHYSHSAMPLPRTHGGVSPRESLNPPRSGSSPYPRGCFPLLPIAVDSTKLFPVPTGVFLRDAIRAYHKKTLPRTHGGVSRVLPLFSLCNASSPYPRGCFLFGDREDTHIMLFPVPTGVFPSFPCAQSLTSALPRTHGGVSNINAESPLCSVSSPYPRGCFW